MRTELPISSGQTVPQGAPRVDVPGARDNPFGKTEQLPEGYESAPSLPKRQPKHVVPPPTTA